MSLASDLLGLIDKPAGQGPVSQLTNLVDAGIQAYLSTTLTMPLAHQVAMGVLGGTSFVGTMLARAQSGGVRVLSAQWVNRVANEVNQVLQYPNIEGITIYANSVDVHREVDVSNTPVIQQSISARTYVTDSATPMPRTFKVSGYIQSLMPELDVGTAIKPTVLAQAKYLDSAAMSRCPVWFKDNYNRFHLVLINRFNERHVPEHQNALQVDIEMTEYIPYVAEEMLGNTLTKGMSTFFKKAVQK